MQLETILTPLQSLLKSAEQIKGTFVSIETTPFIASSKPEKMKLIQSLGVQRISMGVQSSSASILSSMNRKDQINANILAMQNLRNAEFKRISIDIIFGLPNQTMNQWIKDLQTVIHLRPDSITTYDCLYRGKGRAMKRKIDSVHVPSPDNYGEMYDYAFEMLVKHGYFAHYGSINFSIHAEETGTSAYFENRLVKGYPYIGLGNYASSLLGKHWIFAPYAVDSWIASISDITSNGHRRLKSDLLTHWPVQDAYCLSFEERAAKYILLTLSFGFIDETYFSAAFSGIQIRDIYGLQLEYLTNVLGYLMFDASTSRYYLKHGSFRHMHLIRSMFYSEQCLSWYESNILGLSNMRLCT
jgi:oxygen-independent coproporphyrinogen-3 oxidase